MKTLLAVLGACLALGVVGGGCGGDSDDSATGPQQEPAPGAAKEATTDGGGAAIEVAMKDISFKPASVSVPKGGTVIWTNEESFGHDVTKTGGPGPAFNSGAAGGMAKGATFEQTFRIAGAIKYVCRVHAGMEGTLTVK